MGLVDLVRDLLVTTGSLIHESTSNLLHSCESGINAVSNGVTFLFTSPWVALFIGALLVLSLGWYPYHHIAESGFQVCFTCLINPLNRNVLQPLVNKLKVPVTALFRYINVLTMFPRVVLWDVFVTIPLTCNGTAHLIKGSLRAVQFEARALENVIRIAVNATTVDEVSTNATALAASLALDGVAQFTDGMAGMISCYCAPCAYLANVATLTAQAKSLRCMISNALGFVAEAFKQCIKTGIRLTVWLLDLFSWVVSAIFPDPDSVEEPVEFPKFNATYVFFDLYEMRNRYNAFFCCSGDLVDDVVASFVNVSIEITILTLDDVSAVANTNDDIRVGGLIRGWFPLLSDNIYEIYTFFIRLLTNFDNPKAAFDAIDTDRLLDSYAGFCIEETAAFKSVVSANATGLYGLQHNTMVDTITVVTTYGVAAAVTPIVIVTPAMILPLTVFAPQAVNSSCLSLVHLARGLINIVKRLPTYSEYATGDDLDCFALQMREIPEGLESDLNRIFDLLPRPDSCTLNTSGTLPSITCNASMFNGNMGRVISMPMRMATNVVDYTLSATQHLNSFDEFRSVDPNFIFDDLREDMVAVGGVAEGLIKSLIPLHKINFTLPDTPLVINLGNASGLQYIPGTITALGTLPIELLRFFVELARRGDFDNWEFDPEILQQLIYAQYDFINKTAEFVTAIPCAIKNAAAAQGLENECYYSPGNNICPLKMIPCPRETVAALGRAMYRLVDVLPSVITAPNTFAAYEMLGPIIGELKNAGVGLSIAMEGLEGITYNFSGWETYGTLNFGTSLSSIYYGIFSLYDIMNTVVIEGLRFAMHDLKSDVEGVQSSSPMCSVEYPIKYAGRCYRCDSSELFERYKHDNPSETLVAGTPNSDTCARIMDKDTRCCTVSGRCTRGKFPCANADHIRQKTDQAIVALNTGLTHIFDPFGMINTDLMRYQQRLAGMAAHLIQSTLQTAFVAPFSSQLPSHLRKSYSFSRVLPKFTCMMEDAGWAGAHGLTVPFALAGNVAGLVSYLLTDETASGIFKDLSTGLHDMTTSTGRTAHAYVAIFSHGAAIALSGAGLLIDGDVSLDTWNSLLSDAVADMDKTIPELEIAVGDMVTAADFTHTNQTCESAVLAKSMVGLWTTMITQTIHGVAGMVQIATGVQSNVHIDLDEVYTKARRTCLSISLFTMSILTHAVDNIITLADKAHVTVPGITTSFQTSVHKMADGVAQAQGLIFMIPVTGVECSTNFLIATFPVLSRIFSSTVASADILKPAYKWTRGFLYASVSIVEGFWPDLARTLKTAADFVDGVASNAFNTASQTLAAIGVFIGDSIGNFFVFILHLSNPNAVTEYASASVQTTRKLFESLVSSYSRIVNAAATIIDDVLFRFVPKIGPFGPVACAINITPCFKTFLSGLFNFNSLTSTISYCFWHISSCSISISSFFSRRAEATSTDFTLNTTHFEMSAGHISMLALMFPINDRCRRSMLQWAFRLQDVEINTTNGTAFIQAIEPTNITWYDLLESRVSIVQCMKRTQTDNLTMWLLGNNTVPNNDHANFSTDATISEAVRQEVSRVFNGIECGNSSIFTTDITYEYNLCMIRRFALIQHFMDALMANASSLEYEMSALEGYMVGAGYAPDEIENYHTIFLKMRSMMVGDETTNATSPDVLYSDMSTENELVITEDSETPIQKRQEYQRAKSFFVNMLSSRAAGTVTESQKATFTCGHNISYAASSFQLFLQNIDGAASSNSACTDMFTGAAIDGCPPPGVPEAFRDCNIGEQLQPDWIYDYQVSRRMRQSTRQQRSCTYRFRIPCERCPTYKWIPDNATESNIRFYNPRLAIASTTATRSTTPRTDALPPPPPPPSSFWETVQGDFDRWESTWSKVFDDKCGEDCMPSTHPLASLKGAFRRITAPTARKSSKIGKADPAPTIKKFKAVAGRAILRIASMTTELACQKTGASFACSHMPARGTTTTTTTTPLLPGRSKRDINGEHFQILPSVEAAFSDCFIMCQYNWTLAAERSCLWRATKRNGPLGRAFDALMRTRSEICSFLFPNGDSVNRADATNELAKLFTMETLDTSIPDLPYDTSMLGDTVVASFISSSSRYLINQVIGTNSTGRSIQSVAGTLLAKMVGLRDFDQLKTVLVNSSVNFNTDHSTGMVGLFYYLTTPTPIGVDCYKVEDMKVGGVHVYFPWWFVLPPWLPETTDQLLTMMSNVTMILPDGLIKSNGHCDQFVPDITLPFTVDCACQKPMFYNCGERHGFLDPLDTIAFAFDVWLPGVADSYISYPFLYNAGIYQKFVKFRNVTTLPNFNEYMTCFGITMGGLLWALLLSVWLLLIALFNIGILITTLKHVIILIYRRIKA